MSSYYRQQLEEWLAGLTVVGGDVLDVGGEQKHLYGRLKKFEPKDYLILDTLKGADVIWDLNSPGKFNEVFPFRKEKFDTIFCLEVFEYLVNPLNAVMNLAEWLKSGGTAYITFAFVYPIHNPAGTDMLRYTENWIRKVLDHYGFKDIEITTRNDRSGILQSFYRNDGMKAQVGIDHSVCGYIVKAVKQ